VRILLICAISLVMFGGTVRAQTMGVAEYSAHLRRQIQDAEDKRVAELEKTPEGRAKLAVEQQEAKARADANDPVVQARLRAYKRKHRSIVAAKKPATATPAKKQAVAPKSKSAATKPLITDSTTPK
jgi:hypothetical protein